MIRSPRQPRPSTGVLVLSGLLAPGDLPRLCDRLRRLLRDSGAEVVVCDVGALPADVATVEVLARLQLTACRLGGRIRLQRASPELVRLLAFVGLAGVLSCGGRTGLRRERGRQLEEREQTIGVEERVDRDDAIT